MTALPYDEIGDYRVTGLLGRGGFATVYRAVDDRLDDEIAIKVLADNYAVDPDIRSRFVTEGRLLRRIDHPHLVRIHDVGETPRGQPYLVLELADRGDLATRVAQRRAAGWTASPAEVVEIADALLGAAGALHGQRLVHRDLKPDNVLLRSTSQQVRAAPAGSRQALFASDERLMVSDLGFTKDLGENSGFTVAGGSSTFGAPEQFRGEPVTAQADLYAVARVLDWLVDDDPHAAWHDDLRQALAPALHADPSRRPESAGVLAATIRQALVTDRPGGVEAQQSASAAAPARSSSTVPTRVLVAAAGALAVLVLGLLLVTGGSDPAPVEPVGENRGRSTAITDQAVVTIEGPLTLASGQAADYIATGPAGSRFVWTLPSGATIADAQAVTITAVEAGSAVLKLRTELSSGDVVDLDFSFEVTP